MATTEQIQLTLPAFEGAEWPLVRLVFGGKYEHDLELGAEADTGKLIEAFAGTRIGESFRLVVTGELVAKTHQIKRDAQSGLISDRVLAVKLAIDGVSPAE